MDGCGRWLLILVGYLLTAAAGARALDNRGKSFLLPFTPNYGEGTENVILITSQHDANIYINNPNAPLESERQREYSVQSGGSLRVKLAGPVAISTNQVTEKKAVLLVASRPVAVYGLSLESRSSDGYLALPLEALGTHYLAATYDTANSDGGAQLAVAAAEDDTEVNVTIRVLEPTTCGNVTLSTSDRVQIAFRLHAQDVVRVLCSGDITGSVVNSTKPVAVISGNVCVKVPTNRLYCDHVVEMMVPVPALGTRYLLHTFKGRDSGAIYRIVPSQPGTQLNYGSGLQPFYVGDLPFHQFKLEQEQTGWVSTGTLIVTTDKPVMAVGYTLGQMTLTSDYQGDPFMTLLTSPDLAPADYTLDLNLTGNHGDRKFTCYVTAVVKDEFSQGVYVGNQRLLMESAEDNLSIGALEISSWPTRVYHEDPQASVAVVAYCFADGEGVGFPAGYTLQDFTGDDECASSPCDNGGICYGVGASYRCHCLDVFGGDVCQQDIVDECDSRPCSNGGSCVDGVRSFTCLCLPGYTGLTCTDVIQTTTLPPETTTESTTTTPPPPETTEVVNEVIPEPPAQLCPCSCQHPQLLQPSSRQNESAERQQQKEIANEIKEELTVNAKNTSKVRNQLQSAVDTRASATGVGIVGVSLLALVVGFIIVLDAATLVSHIVSKIGQRRKSSLRKSKSSEVKEDTDEAGDQEQGSGSQSHVAAVSALGSDVSSNGDLAQVEVARFAESVAAMEGCQGNHDSALPQHRGSRRKHLLHVRPETILLHVPTNTLTRKDSRTDLRK